MNPVRIRQKRVEFRCAPTKRRSDSGGIQASSWTWHRSRLSQIPGAFNVPEVPETRWDATVLTRTSLENLTDPLFKPTEYTEKITISTLSEMRGIGCMPPSGE